MNQALEASPFVPIQGRELDVRVILEAMHLGQILNSVTIGTVVRELSLLPENSVISGAEVYRITTAMKRFAYIIASPTGDEILYDVSTSKQMVRVEKKVGKRRYGCTVPTTSLPFFTRLGYKVVAEFKSPEE